jgi:hypothetical protein
MNWRRAGLASKRSTSVANDAEFRERDAAARWLAKHDKATQRPKRKRSGKKSNRRNV